MPVGKITFSCPVCGVDCKADLEWKKTLVAHMAKIRKLNEWVAQEDWFRDEKVNQEALDATASPDTSEQGVQEQEGI